MTKAEVIELLEMNRRLYTNSAKPMTEDEAKTIIDVWHYHFRDFPGDEVKRAFLAANRDCVFPIQAADIFKHLRTERPQFADVLKAAREIDRWYYYAQSGGIVDSAGKLKAIDCVQRAEKAFNALPEEVKQWAGTAKLLSRYAGMDETELAQYVKPGFDKAVKDCQLPPKKMIEGSNKKCLKK